MRYLGILVGCAARSEHIEKMADPTRFERATSAFGGTLTSINIGL